jgi:signal transduction histidine kinase
MLVMVTPRAGPAHRPPGQRRACARRAISGPPDGRLSAVRRRSTLSLAGDPPGCAPSYDQIVKWLVGRVMTMPSPLQDLLLAVALTLFNVGTLVPYYGRLPRPALAFALVVLESLPLIWRQSWPVAALAVIGAARVGYDYAIGAYAPLPLGPAIGFYTVMKLSSPAMRWTASAVTLVAILSSQRVPGHNEPYDFFVAALVFVAAGMAGLLSRARQQSLAEAQTRAARAESDRDREVAAAAARERTRIARELHDVVAHHVSLMAVQAEAAASLLPGHPEARHSVEVISDTARQALSELRRLLGVLRGPAEHPLTPPSRSLDDIAAVIDQVHDAGLAVELRVEGEPGQLAPGVGLTAYRIIQEALTNTIRHSAAASATVTLSYEPEHITVRVADAGLAGGNGVRGGRGVASGDGVRGRRSQAAEDGQAAPGSPPGRAGAAESAGFGLAGIAERVASCGGSLTVGPTGVGGFAVTARLPAL